MKLATTDEEFQMRDRQESPIHSSIRNDISTRKKGISKCFYVTIICMLLVIALYLAVQLGNESQNRHDETHDQLAKQVEDIANNGKNVVQLSQKIQQIEGQLDQMRKKQQLNEDTIVKLKEQINALQNQKGTLNNKEKPPPQRPVRPKIDHDYMTPAFAKISEDAYQKEGTKPVVPGTVTQIEFLKKNHEGKTIDQVLYDAENRQKRRQFHQNRIKWAATRKDLQGFFLINYNNKLDTSHDEEQARVEAQWYQKIDQTWNFNNYPQELPLCIVMPGFNNDAGFRIEYNLNSVFSQNYTNFFVVIINDASTDSSDLSYRKYLDFYGIKKENYVYLQNNERLTALENFWIATYDYCSQDSIVITVDADDELVGKNAFKIFNVGYQKYKLGVAYSNFFQYSQGSASRPGFTGEYTPDEKMNRSYRKATQRFSHLRSYRTELFRMIDKKDFLDENGKFYRMTYDFLMFFPLLELACDHVKKLDGIHYLYKYTTGLNDHSTNIKLQQKLANVARNKPKYECSADFDRRMKA